MKPGPKATHRRNEQQQIEKLCRGCNTFKLLVDFHKCRRNPDGRQTFCRACLRTKCLIAAKARGYDPAKVYLNTVRYRQRNPEAYKAHRIASKLDRQPCSSCGEIVTDAHHEDYRKPLAVIFLCRKCHFKLHNERRRK